MYLLLSTTFYSCKDTDPLHWSLKENVCHKSGKTDRKFDKKKYIHIYAELIKRIKKKTGGKEREKRGNNKLNSYNILIKTHKFKTTTKRDDNSKE